MRTLSHVALALALLGAAGSARAQTAENTELTTPSPTPAYLPRSVILGMNIDGAATWQGRLQWEVTLIDQPRNSFVLLFEGGGGYGLVLPGDAGPLGSAQVSFFYQHVLLVGAGYRALYQSGFSWGFSADFGPIFYGARYKNELPKENFTVVGAEGYLQAGWRFGKVTYGVRLGVCEALGDEPASYAIAYISPAFAFGLFADWR